MQIKLDDCPQVLQDAVKEELERYNKYPEYAKVISCVSYGLEETTYKVYLRLLYETFVILTNFQTPALQDDVLKDMVTIGDIKEIFQTAPEVFVELQLT